MKALSIVTIFDFFITIHCFLYTIISSTMALEIVRQYYAQYDAVAAPIGASILSWATPQGWTLNVTKVNININLFFCFDKTMMIIHIKIVLTNCYVIYVYFM